MWPACPVGPSAPGSTTQGRGGVPAPAEPESKGERDEEMRVLTGVPFLRWVGKEEGRRGVVGIGAQLGQYREASDWGILDSQ